MGREGTPNGPGDRLSGTPSPDRPLATGAHPAGPARGTDERGSSRWIWMTAAAAVGLLFGLMVFVVTVA